MKKKATLALVLSLTLGLLTGCGGGAPKKPNDFLKGGSAAVFAGGDGTEEHPYVITTPEGLSAVRDNLTTVSTRTSTFPTRTGRPSARLRRRRIRRTGVRFL